MPGTDAGPDACTGAPDFRLRVTRDGTLVGLNDRAYWRVYVDFLCGFDEPVFVHRVELPPQIYGDYSKRWFKETGSTSLVLRVFAGAPPGAHTLTIVGTSSSLTRTAVAILNVTADPTFLISVPESVTVERGGRDDWSLSVDRLNGFSAPLTVDVLSLPDGVRFTCDPYQSTDCSFSADWSAPGYIPRVWVVVSGGGTTRNSVFEVLIDP